LAGHTARLEAQEAHTQFWYSSWKGEFWETEKGF